jgi:hypothetical protein
MSKLHISKENIMNNIITKTNAVLNSVGEAIHTTFGILFGGKTFIKSIPSYEEIIVMN